VPAARTPRRWPGAAAGEVGDEVEPRANGDAHRDRLVQADVVVGRHEEIVVSDP
jgi:hypothetical protein